MILQKINIDILHQLTDLLEDLDCLVYQEMLEPLHQHSVGQHVRHITEFYLCLLKGLETGKVNYDARERNLTIELDRNYTLEVLSTIKNRLEEEQEDTTLVLQSAFGMEKAIEIQSTYFRELVYLIEHTIHHLAIIKIGLNEVHPEIAIAPDFGVAHSTIQYRKRVEA